MFPWTLEPTAERIEAMRDTSLSKLVRDRVLAQILRGDWAPGQRINEPDVAAELKVSRVPVREALRELESSGLVVARKHAGVFVREWQPREIADLYELRALLDGYAGERAARLPDAERHALQQRLNQTVADMESCAGRADVAAYYSSNLQFHWLIVDAAGNQEAAQTYRAVVQKLHLARLKNLSRDLGIRISIAEHVEIARAIASGDASGARQSLTQHVLDAHRRLQISESPPLQPPGDTP